MIAYAPGLLPKGVTNPAAVRNLDLAPTFLEVAGVPEPSHMEGESFLKVAKGEVAPWDWRRGDFIYEYYWEWTFPHTPTTFAIERDRIKYIQYHGVWDLEELYDLEKDPDEMRNLIDDPAYFETKITLRKALFEQLANSKGQHVVPFRKKTSNGIVLRNINGPRAADFPPTWYVQPNLPTRANDMLADSPAKAKATAEGRPYVPAPK